MPPKQMSAFFKFKKWEFCFLPNFMAQKRGERAGGISDSPVALMEVPGTPETTLQGLGYIQAPLAGRTSSL